jgi:hypothetical protein
LRRRFERFVKGESYVPSSRLPEILNDQIHERTGWFRLKVNDDKRPSLIAPQFSSFTNLAPCNYTTKCMEFWFKSPRYKRKVETTNLQSMRSRRECISTLKPRAYAES